MSVPFKCDSLGNIAMVDVVPDKHDENKQEMRYFACDYILDHETLKNMQAIARTIAGIEIVEYSNRTLENGKTADFRIVFQAGIKAPQATQSSIDMMRRVTRNLNLHSAHDRGNIAMAINSEVRRFE